MGGVDGGINAYMGVMARGDIKLSETFVNRAILVVENDRGFERLILGIHVVMEGRENFNGVHGHDDCSRQESYHGPHNSRSPRET